MIWNRRGEPKREDVDGAEHIFDRGQPGGDLRLATASWLRGKDLKEWALDPSSELYYSTHLQRARHDTGTVYLGATHPTSGEPIGWCDDRHLITVAGSRAGKGVSAILPNLHLYRGPVVCIDPKGENATTTADHRARDLGQDVHVLDPYGTVTTADPKLRSAHDPLYGLKVKDPEIVEKINLIAESMIIPSEGKDIHWDELSRAFLAALIGHVISVPDLGMPRNLITVRSLFRKGDPEMARRLMVEGQRAYLEESGEDGEGEAGGTVAFETPDVGTFDALLEALSRNDAFDGMISGLAQRLQEMGHEERGSVLSTTDRHTRFLDGAPMQSVLVKPQGGQRKHLILSRLKRGKTPVTVYLCLPPRYLATHARWLRLMINGILAAAETTPQDQAEDAHRILAILDEFPVLGYMRTLEAAVGYMAGYGIRIWAILQDLNQLKRDYPRSWETFLGNTGLQQFFGNTDQTTLEYLSKALGETEVVRTVVTTSGVSQADVEGWRERSKSLLDNPDYTTSRQAAEQIMKMPLMTPDEIRVTFSREKRRQILISAEFDPIVAYRRVYYEMDAPGGLLDELARRP